MHLVLVVVAAAEATATRPALHPGLSASDVRRLAANVEASLGRVDRVAALGASAPSLTAYAAIAVEAPPRPPPFGAEFETSAGVAVLLCGQARSFLSAAVQRFWREWTAGRRAARVTVFGAVDLRSGNRGDIAGVRNWRDLDHVVDRGDVSAAMARLGVAYVAAWNASLAEELRAAGVDEVRVHFSMIDDVPGVRDLLGPARNGAGGARALASFGGTWLGYVKKVVAFAALLRFERAARQSFSHVVVVRPDMVYATMTGVDFFDRLVLLEGLALVDNDVLGVVPRDRAFSYCASIALARLQLGVDAPGDGGVAAARAATGAKGSLLQPTNMLALDGSLFAGHKFEYSGTTSASFDLSDGAPLWCVPSDARCNATFVPSFFVRETDAKGGVCVTLEDGARFLNRTWRIVVPVCVRAPPRAPPETTARSDAHGRPPAARGLASSGSSSSSSARPRRQLRPKGGDFTGRPSVSLG